MDMHPISSGNLRAIGYDRGGRLLRVEFHDGNILQFRGVGEELWRRFRGAGSPWSFYRDNIEEEFTGERVAAKPPAGRNPLDDLFGGG